MQDAKWPEGAPQPLQKAGILHSASFLLHSRPLPVLSLEQNAALAYSDGVQKSIFARWQANFWAGLVIVLPAVISLAVLRWLFGTVANITDTLLIFLPAKLTHHDQGNGPMYWYWSLVALVLAAFLIGTVGLLARNYFGQKIIEWVDSALMRIPLLEGRDFTDHDDDKSLPVMVVNQEFIRRFLPNQKLTAVTSGLDAVTAGFFSASTLWPNLHVTPVMRERAWASFKTY